MLRPKAPAEVTATLSNSLLPPRETVCVDKTGSRWGKGRLVRADGGLRLRMSVPQGSPLMWIRFKRAG